MRSDGAGRFTLRPSPDVPLTLIVVGARGEIYPPLYVPSPGVVDLRLDHAFRESITVTSGAAPNIETTPGAVASTIGREELEERKPAHLADAIAVTPGVAVRGEGAPAVPVLRGLAAGRTLLLIDDARVVSERRAGPSATFLNPFTLASVEVARGPGSVAYGSDALGGVVHARSNDPVRGVSETRYDVWGSVGGESALSGAVDTSFDVLGGALLAAIYGRSGDDSQDSNGDVIPNSSYRDRGISLRYVADFEKTRLRLSLASDRARDVGAPAADARVVRTYYPWENSDRFSFALDVEPGFEFRGALGRNEINTSRERLPTGEVTAVNVEARDASLRAAAARHGERSRLLFGADFVSRFGLRATGSVEDAHKRDLGLFAVREHQLLQRVSISTGLRLDFIAIANRGGFAGDRSREDLAWSGHLGVTAGPWSNVTGTLQVSSGYREPSLSDRYFRGVSGRGFVTGNPDLEPERSLQFDALVRWQRGVTSVVLAGYDYEIRDLVERYQSGADFFFRNRGRASIRGVELEAEARLWRSVTLRAGAAYARGVARDDDAALDDIAAPNVMLEVRKAGQRYSLFATGRLYARDDRPGPIETERPGYAAIDAGAGWHLYDAVELRLLIRNATNHLHAGSADANAALAPGRSVMLGLNGRLR